jgi:motility quorum-sensing regulator/GCU-specific mRNA interferase toxin
MEKRTPHCKLAVVKTMVGAGKVRITISALVGGAALGFGCRSPRLAGRVPAEAPG